VPLDADTGKRAKKALRDLSVQAGTAASSLELNPAEVPANWQNVLGQFHDLVELLGEQGGQVAEFSDFLGSIANGLVRAQTALDGESRRYLAASASSPHVPPSVFRLPRVKANMKMALESVRKEKTSFIVYAAASKARELHEQSIEFEVVAAPAPPDAIAAVARLGLPDVRFVLDRGERARIFGGPITLPEPLTRSPNRVLIVPTSDGAAIYLVVAHKPGAGEEATKPENYLGAWCLRAAALDEAYRYGTSPTGGEKEGAKQLYGVVVGACDRQEAFLRA